jgi:YVTN family beta-propeller protein
VTSAPANGTVTVNPTTGAFSYTPTQAARLVAGQTSGPVTDTFTVKVSDGLASTTIPVTVPVSQAWEAVNPASVPLGGIPQGMAVSPNGSQAYVTNVSNNTVSVVNTATNTTVASIPVGSNPFAIAVSPNGSTAYVTNMNSNTVSVINTATNTVTATIPVGTAPAGMAISPNGSTAYVTNLSSNTVSVIDTATNTVTASIPVGTAPVGIAVSPNGSQLYVANSGAGQAPTVSVINTATNTVAATVAMPVGTAPVGIAVSPNGNQLYVASYTSGTVAVIDTQTKTIVGSPIAVGPNPWGVAVSPDGSLAYVSNGNNTITVLNTKTNTVLGTLTAASAPVNSQQFVALSPNGSQIYTTDGVNQALHVSSIVSTPVPQQTVLVSGLNAPVDFAFLPDGRMLIAGIGGDIQVFNPNTGQLQSRPLVTIPVSTGGDRGVGGIAVDPNFAQNGNIYVSYITPDSYERLSRFTVTDPTAVVLTVDPASEEVLLQGNQPAADSHLGGAVRFGPDGKLYLSVGNNDFWVNPPPGFTYPSNNAQDLSNIYGKILRLNPDGTVPSDNPFASPADIAAGDNPYIYAYGFRNPFRMAFTSTGQLLVADAGEAAWEEVDNVTAGGNYGWPLAEGPCNGIGTTSCSTPSAYINPIYSYGHTGNSTTISAVLHYTGSAFGPTYQNDVFIADWSHGTITALTCASGYTACGSPTSFGPIDNAFDGPVELLQGPDGNIYALQIGSGTLSRIGPPNV